MFDLVEFRHLKYIAAIAETGNFTRAAERLFLAQPSLSKQIKDLEDGIGIQIFVRHHDGVRVTAAGQMVVSYAIEAVKARNEIFLAARAVHTGEIPALRIGFSCFVHQNILRSMSDAYASLLPNRRIQLAGGDPGQILRRMQENNLDAVVLPLPISGSDWAIERIASAPLVVCMRADDPLAQQTKIQPSELGTRLKISRSPEAHPISFSISISRACVNWTADTAFVNPVRAEHPALPILIRHFRKVNGAKPAKHLLHKRPVSELQMKLLA